MKLFLLILFAFLQFNQIFAENTCNSCMDNGVLCTNQTAFQICNKGVPMGKPISCAKNEVCTSTDNICENEDDDGVTAVCSSPCGVCPEDGENKMYSCESRTQFGICIGGSVTYTGSCDDDTECSAELYALTGTICAPKSVLQFFEFEPTCDNDMIEVTTAKPIEPDVDNYKLQCEAKVADNPDKKFFYVLNAQDDTCKTYIYCEEIDNVMEVALIRCKSGFFNEETQKCDAGLTGCAGDGGNGGQATTETPA